MKEYRSEKKNMIAESDSETEELKTKILLFREKRNGSRDALLQKFIHIMVRRFWKKSIRNGLIVIK